MTIASSLPRTWRFPSMLLKGHIAFGSLMWMGLVLLTVAIAVALDRFTEVSDSTWEQSSQVVPWYVGGVSGYILYQTVPMFIGHGRTRRDTAIEVLIFMVIFATVAAVLVAAGYLIEYVVYGMAGWPRDLSGDQLFDSHLDVLLIVVQYWLISIVWAASGALVGAAFYRYDANGWLALIPASILIGLIGTFTQGFWGLSGFVVDRFLPVETPSLPLAIVTAGACVLIALAMTWPILRDLPIRNR